MYFHDKNVWLLLRKLEGKNNDRNFKEFFYFYVLLADTLRVQLKSTNLIGSAIIDFSLLDHHRVLVALE